jgi:hypothetical protein
MNCFGFQRVGVFVLQIFLGNGENFEIMKGTAVILGKKEA